MHDPTDALPHDPDDAARWMRRWMRRCLRLARRGAGAVSPNPMVGAVLVSPAGEVLGEGWHARYGGPHAERAAVADAVQRHGAAALRQATLYVNLEPCSHHGKTPPCADLVLEHGIPRVVVGMVDPFPAVAGSGVARLQAQGVAVRVGVEEAACRRLNEAFVHHLATGRPLVTLKLALTLDGQVATATGDSRWVTGPAARRRVHRWRATLDAVLVGRGTAACDDPALTVRHAPGRQPVRVVLDRPGTLSPQLQLFTDAWAARTLAVVAAEAPTPAYAERLAAAGGRLWRLPLDDGGRLDLDALLRRLGREGAPDGRPLQSLLVEAGPGLATALLKQDLADRVFAFVAPRLLGQGTPAVGDLGLHRMADALTFAAHRWERVGADVLLRGYRRPLY